MFLFAQYEWQNRQMVLCPQEFWLTHLITAHSFYTDWKKNDVNLVSLDTFDMVDATTSQSIFYNAVVVNIPQRINEKRNSFYTMNARERHACKCRCKTSSWSDDCPVNPASGLSDAARKFRRHFGWHSASNLSMMSGTKCFFFEDDDNDVCPACEDLFVNQDTVSILNYFYKKLTPPVKHENDVTGGNRRLYNRKRGSLSILSCEAPEFFPAKTKKSAIGDKYLLDDLTAVSKRGTSDILDDFLRADLSSSVPVELLSFLINRNKNHSNNNIDKDDYGIQQNLKAILTVTPPPETKINLAKSSNGLRPAPKPSDFRKNGIKPRIRSTKRKFVRHCDYCFRSGMDESMYDSHCLRNPITGYVMCPILMGNVCRKCGDTGDEKVHSTVECTTGSLANPRPLQQDIAA